MNVNESPKTFEEIFTPYSQEELDGFVTQKKQRQIDRSMKWLKDNVDKLKGTKVLDEPCELSRFDGFYNSILSSDSKEDGDMAYIDDEREGAGLDKIDWDELPLYEQIDLRGWEKAVSEAYVNELNKRMKEKGFDFNLRLIEIIYPHQYNYSHESLVCSIGNKNYDALIALCDYVLTESYDIVGHGDDYSKLFASVAGGISDWVGGNTYQEHTTFNKENFPLDAIFDAFIAVDSQEDLEATIAYEVYENLPSLLNFWNNKKVSYRDLLSLPYAEIQSLMNGKVHNEETEMNEDWRKNLATAGLAAGLAFGSGQAQGAVSQPKAKVDVTQKHKSTSQDIDITKLDNIVARVIAGEAANQEEEGMYAVACVIQNRMKKGKTAKQVVTKPKAFSAYDHDSKLLIQNYTVKIKPYVDLLASKLGNLKDVTGGADQYVTIECYKKKVHDPNHWVSKMLITKVIRDHVFMKERR